MKATGVYKCPDDSSVPTASNENVVSYAYNKSILGGASTRTNGFPGVITTGAAISGETAPAQTVLLTEVVGAEANLLSTAETDSPAVNGFTGCGGSNFNGTAATSPAKQYASGLLGNVAQNVDSSACDFSSATGRHTDGANYLLADGHVKWLRGSAVSFGFSAVSPSDLQDVTGSVTNASGAAYNAAGTGVGTYVATFSPI